MSRWRSLARLCLPFYALLADVCLIAPLGTCAVHDARSTCSCIEASSARVPGNVEALSQIGSGCVVESQHALEEEDVMFAAQIRMSSSFQPSAAMQSADVRPTPAGIGVKPPLSAAPMLPIAQPTLQLPPSPPMSMSSSPPLGTMFPPGWSPPSPQAFEPFQPMVYQSNVGAAPMASNSDTYRAPNFDARAPPRQIGSDPVGFREDVQMPNRMMQIEAVSPLSPYEQNPYRDVPAQDAQLQPYDRGAVLSDWRRGSEPVSMAQLSESRPTSFLQDGSLQTELAEVTQEAVRLRERNAALEKSVRDFRQSGFAPGAAEGLNSTDDGQPGFAPGAAEGLNSTDHGRKAQEQRVSLKRCLLMSLLAAVAQIGIPGAIWAIFRGLSKLCPGSGKARSSGCSPCSSCLGAICSPRTVVHVMILMVFLDFGFGVMWHYGMLQPFLKQIVVYLYFLFAIIAIIGLLLMEAIWTMKSKVEVVHEMLTFLHDKTDDMLDMLGLSSPDARADGQYNENADEDDGQETWNLWDAEPDAAKRSRSIRKQSGGRRKGHCC